jgi:hypothetical protein
MRGLCLSLISAPDFIKEWSIACSLVSHPGSWIGELNPISKNAYQKKSAQ